MPEVLTTCVNSGKRVSDPRPVLHGRARLISSNSRVPQGVAATVVTCKCALAEQAAAEGAFFFLFLRETPCVLQQRTNKGPLSVPVCVAVQLWAACRASELQMQICKVLLSIRECKVHGPSKKGL
jgi:hypothetical protein